MFSFGTKLQLPAYKIKIEKNPKKHSAIPKGILKIYVIKKIIFFIGCIVKVGRSAFKNTVN